MNEDQIDSTGGLAARVSALQRQVFLLLLMLLIVGATLCGYLAYQDHICHKDAAAIRPRAVQWIGQFQKIRAGVNTTQVQAFVNSLVAYGAGHPDFERAVLAKYGLNGSPAPVKK
ncbi:MAG: hypothetical protein KGR98_03305 [Verrucomicrobia bacterium]|nr:hypothetical protein [Verrucomicrobiota bacterium]MDE3100493.1 hypothetical protein [Verrucomicrobiota bacterium]